MGRGTLHSVRKKYIFRVYPKDTRAVVVAQLVERSLYIRGLKTVNCIKKMKKEAGNGPIFQKIVHTPCYRFHNNVHLGV